MEHHSNAKEGEDLNLDELNFNKNDQNIPTFSRMETNEQNNLVDNTEFQTKPKKLAPPLPVFQKNGKK
jgi:hypothetical protein